MPLLSDVMIIDATDRLGWLAGRILADLGADVIKLEPAGSDRSRPEWRAFNVNKRVLELGPGHDRAELGQLLAAADICLVTPASCDADLDPDALRASHPRLVVVAIRPFGGVGPRKGWKASDLELMAAGGAMALAGEPDGVPVRVSEPQSYGWAGAQAAIGALVALFHRDSHRPWRPRRCVRPSLGGDRAVARAGLRRSRRHRADAGRRLHDRPLDQGRALSRVLALSRRLHQFHLLRRGCAGGAPTSSSSPGCASAVPSWARWQAIDWKSWDPTKADQAEVDAIEAPVMKFFAGLTKREFLIEGHRREMLGYPVATVADIAGDPQLEARGFFQSVAGSRRALLRQLRHRRWRAAAAAPRARRAVRPRFAASRSSRQRRRRAGPTMTAVAQALAGVRVLEFGGFAAGPHIGKLMANFGASVIHVESRERPDGFRIQYPPFKDDRPGYNRSGCFAFFNDSKYSVTVDLKKPEGVALARRMAQWCDLIIENMRPGVMERLGLGFPRAVGAQSAAGDAVDLQHGTDRTARRPARLRLAAIGARRHVRPDRLSRRAADAALRALYRLHRLHARSFGRNRRRRSAAAGAARAR